ncbi:MAG: CsbD family protein [Pirellulales bacterium]
MDWEQIKCNWTQVSDMIKLTWGKLSEDDLAAIAGRREQLSGMLQQRYGYAKLHAEMKVDDFARQLKAG